MHVHANLNVDVNFFYKNLKITKKEPVNVFDNDGTTDFIKFWKKTAMKFDLCLTKQVSEQRNQNNCGMVS